MHRAVETPKRLTIEHSAHSCTGENATSHSFISISLRSIIVHINMKYEHFCPPVFEKKNATF